MLAVLLCMSLAGVAVADDYAHSASHVTQKSPSHVLDVLTAYQDICDEGCKYYGPDVVRFIRISERQTDSTWYTWTHVKTGLKQTMYFSEVKISGRSADGFVFVTRLLTESDKSAVEFLTKRTGLEHSPVFDTGVTTITVKRGSKGVSVTQAMKMSATGMITMFPKRIQAGMEEGAQVTFANIEK